VKSKIKKYFLSILALMLILSNFSFASTYMLCPMDKDESSCCCNHDKQHTPGGQPGGVAFSKDMNGCCSQETVELANSNLLTTVKIELPSDISSFASVLINTVNESLPSVNISQSYISQIEHIPKSDIPILVSSLLI
jgi:hypothetical protein